MKLIVDIPEEIYESQRYAQYFGAWSVVLQKHFENGTSIPDNATNGDVVKALFPKGTTAKFATFMRFIDGEHYFNCSEEWWNEPYQKGGKE